jgi:large subunit ribosomal protein L27e
LTTLPDTDRRFLKVALVLQGRQAGKKVVVIKQLDEGTKERPYPHAVVAGIERYPRKVTRRMGAKKLQSRSKVKPFIKVRHLFHYVLFAYYINYVVWKVVNYSHLFPTRYSLELESLKGAVTSDTFKEPSQREDAKKTIKKLFEEKYTGGKNKWFFTALRVRTSHTILLAMLMTYFSCIVLSGSLILLYATEGRKIICTHDACPLR